MSEYYNALIGGLLIGLASTLMLAGIGRITGISGIIGGSLVMPTKESLWRYSFIIGLILGSLILKEFLPGFFGHTVDAPVLLVIIAGLIVGYGTRLGSGCTSGHGVCGMARLSKRSFLATGIFMSVAMITVLVRGLL